MQVWHGGNCQLHKAAGSRFCSYASRCCLNLLAVHHASCKKTCCKLPVTPARLRPLALNANPTVGLVPQQCPGCACALYFLTTSFVWHRGAPPSEEELQQKKQKLISILKQHDVTVKESSSTHLWQYYPPFAPNWLRLQEVLLPVELEHATSGANGASE